MLTLNESIAKAESKWLDLITHFIDNVYQDIHLPSHDIAHHFRVWNFCKEILREQYIKTNIIDSSIAEEALVACLFHDAGLTIDKSENHGYQSKIICERFFEVHKLHSSINLNRVLNAIEYHDDKSLRTSAARSENDFDLLNMVSTADDLDAFGLIGVFRYIEIYFLRGVNLHDLPSKILSNVEIRFKNFQSLYSSYPQFFSKHNIRFINTFNFFKQIENEINSNSENGFALHVTKVLIDNLIEKKLLINDIVSKCLESENNEIVKPFFRGLKDELDYF